MAGVWRRGEASGDSELREALPFRQKRAKSLRGNGVGEIVAARGAGLVRSARGLRPRDGFSGGSIS
jgi:hypothetical protein